MIREIIVIGSVHKGNGALVHQLYQILCAIEPDVIFEELFEIEYNEIYKNGKKGHLEPQAIKRYLVSHNAQNMPVDLDINDLLKAESINTIKKTFKTFEKNKFYEELSEIKSLDTERHGIPYLNSPQLAILNQDLIELEKRIVNRINNVEMIEAFNNWKDANSKREKAWLKNIQDCSLSFNKAVLIIGADHLNSFKKLISTTQNSAITWHFNYFNNSK